MNKTILALIVSAILANFAGIAVYAADVKTQPVKPVVAKNNGKSLVIPDKIPIDPAENAKLAKEILEKAENNMRGNGDIRTYTSSEETKDPKSGIISASKTFVKLNPDGTEWRRLETLTKMRFGTSVEMGKAFLINDEGLWEIYGDTAVKWAFYKPKPSNAIEKDIIIGYDVKKSKCDEVNCYLVTEKYLKSDKIVKAKQYSIGENDLFIYSTKEYEENGKENPRKAINYRNVKINIPIEDALFKIEDTMKIVIANSIDETIDMFFQKEGEAIVGQLKISEDKKKELNAKIMKKIDENKKGRKPL
jgi:hypothetical protein